MRKQNNLFRKNQLEPLNEIPRQMTRIEITKQARLESILHRYHWAKKPSHSKAYSHLNRILEVAV